VIVVRVQKLLDEAKLHERAGEWQAAAQRYEQAFRAGLAERSVPSFLEALTKLGHSHRLAGNAELAEEVLSATLASARAHGDREREARCLNGLGILRMHAGDISGAEETYLAAGEAARAAGSGRTMGEVEQNLGIISTIRGDVEAALRYYQAGYAHMNEAGHLHGDAGARILMASHPEWVHDVPIDRPAPTDVDTRDDLRSL